ncbi:MAG: transporter substrate-binding domain-containing protein [Syntrophorhabdaceae bacterium]|nr:transporter substrate-binding domain-containing protein [Syntrophorhabdaceae bacterium]
MKRTTLLIFIALALVGAACGPTISDKPVVVTPTVDKPVASAPAVDTPTVSKPAVVTPAEDKPVVSTPTVNTLASIKAKGVLVAGVRGTAPPFGTVNPNTKMNEGYDVDFVLYLAKKLGVKAEFRIVTAVNRIPLLMDGSIDILAAALTITPERTQQIDFSHAYFMTGKKFLAPTGMFKSLIEFNGKKVGTSRGSTSERVMVAVLPTAEIVPFDDYPKAVVALQQKKIHAVATDEAILAGQLYLLEKNPATRGKFEIPDLRVSTELYGLGIRKGDTNFLEFVNKTLIEMEESGEAKAIFQRWFGRNSECPIRRGGFTITKNVSPTE